MNIAKTAAIYNKVSLWILCALTLVGLVVMQVTGHMEYLTPLLVSVIFNLGCSLAYGYTWKNIALRSPETLPKLYLAGSVFRLLAAAVVFLVYCFVVRETPDAIKQFAIVFILYYLVMLVFDAVFFAKVSKNNIK